MMDKKGFTEHFFIIAGEVSGDIHGSKLISAIRKINTQSSFTGIGGDLMASAGLQVRYHIRQMAFLGIGEIIRHLPFIRRVLNDIRNTLIKEAPRAVILIDYPGFNLKVARQAYKLGIPVIYYISPQLWAWGRRRVKKIRRYISKMLVIFPFEVDFYAGYQIDATYVGHPLVDEFSQDLQVQGEKNGERILGLLPGSRIHELNQLLPDMIHTTRILKKEGYIDSAIIATVDSIPKSVYQEFLEDEEDIELLKNDGNAFYSRLDIALVSSGTATLETGYFQVPMVIVYRVNRLTWILGRFLVKLNFIGLANIVAGEKICPELLQNDFTAQSAAHHLIELLNDQKNHEIRKKLAVIKEKLGPPGASARAAQEIITFLSQHK
jgi:lipid-A-disaccharide synthase